MNATRWKHWRVAYREKQLWRQEIRVARLQAGCTRPVPPVRARVTVERFGRPLDPDNFVGGLKSVIDCLKEERLISDDTPETLELIPKQVLGRPRTIITVESA
jgi:Holliday junction resolvase RusA-like endonuclease